MWVAVLETSDSEQTTPIVVGHHERIMVMAYGCVYENENIRFLLSFSRPFRLTLTPLDKQWRRLTFYTALTHTQGPELTVLTVVFSRRQRWHTVCCRFCLQHANSPKTIPLNIRCHNTNNILAELIILWLTHIFFPASPPFAFILHERTTQAKRPPNLANRKKNHLFRIIFYYNTMLSYRWVARYYRIENNWTTR